MTSILGLAHALEQRGLLDVIDTAAAAHHVSRDEILGRSRVQSVVAGRRMFCRALRERGLSYPDIGSLIGRDHSSAMNLVRGAGLRQRPLWLAKTRAEEARCASCGELYGDHRPLSPHILRARGCVGFVLPTAETG